MCASGRDNDYKHDGWSHNGMDDYRLLECFENINCRWPESPDEIENLVDEMINNPKPYYLNLKR
jgi:deoxyxylulose-5-phosphate synthase